MSRPPSARPKTSSGRAPSARRPPTGAGNGPPVASNGSIIRPVSRAPPSRAMDRPPSGSIRPPTSSQSSGGRPLTGLARPPTTSIRPVTQQGLSGGRAVTRLGTASQRQVFDKSYFLGLLRARMAQLKAEIGHLEDVYAKGERDRNQLNSYENRAQESAMELKALQSRLVDINIIIDRMHTNNDMTQIDLEAKRYKEQADELERTVNELFTDRQQRENEVHEVQMEIEAQKKRNEEELATMDPSLRDRYEDLKEVAAELRETASQMQNELTSLEDRRSQLEIELENSSLKKKAVELHSSIAELINKEQELEKEQASKLTPEERRQQLIDSIKKNNDDIATIERQFEQANDHLEQLNEELRQLASDDTQYVKNNEKFRELSLKEKQIEEFLRNFPEDRRLLAMEMEEISDGIVGNLQKISANVGKVNLESKVTDMDPNEVRITENTSPKELQELHVRLQEEMVSLEEMETTFHSEIETLIRRELELNEQSEQFSDIDQLSRDAERKIQELEERKRQLEVDLPDHEKHHDDLQKRLNQLHNELNANPHYAEQTSLQKRLDLLLESNMTLRSSVETRERETNYDSLKQKAFSLKEQYNDFLQANRK